MDLFDCTMKFIYSDVVREHLIMEHELGLFEPTAEDMVSMVFASGATIKDKLSFLTNVITRLDDIRAGGELFAACALLTEPFAENTKLVYKDMLMCSGMTISETEFSSLSEACRYFEENDIRLAYCYVTHKGKKIIDHVCILDGKIELFRMSPMDDDEYGSAADKLMNGYVKIPHPFKKGDRVIDTNGNIYVVLDEKLPEKENASDSIDAAVMVLPEEFSEYVYNTELPDWKQIINMEHEHIYVPFLKYAD